MANKEPINVLILDDEELYRMNISDFVEDEGYTVFVAGSGEEALELVKKQHLDLALVDMRLPGIDGNTFITRANKIQANLRFIIHTGSTSYFIPEELKDIGITKQQIFLKPLHDFEALAQTIEKIIKNNGEKNYHNIRRKKQ